MAHIIKPSISKVITRYFLCFTLANDHSSGFSFQCDVNGVVHKNLLSPGAKANLDLCLTGKDSRGNVLIPDGVKCYQNTAREAAVLKCDCGKNLELYNYFTNECECGRLYNAAGQALAPREQWYL